VHVLVDIKGHGDFTALQPAITALPATGGKIFVKAGVYPLTSTIQISQSNVHIQGEGMGITIFVGDSPMTGDTPGLEREHEFRRAHRSHSIDRCRPYSHHRKQYH
jgi:pectin methylesterase-like acyl-CoA thioesterase